MRQSGSKAVFSAWNADQRASPYIFGLNSVRARPSPCSPEKAPPCSTTRSVTSALIERIIWMPSSSFSERIGRMWRVPLPA
jgi:hypothetical protein